MRKADFSQMEGFSQEIHVTFYVMCSHLGVLQEFIAGTLTFLQMKRVINAAIPKRNVQGSSRSTAITFLFRAMISKCLLQTSSKKGRMIDLAMHRIQKQHPHRTDLCVVSFGVFPLTD